MTEQNDRQEKEREPNSRETELLWRYLDRINAYLDRARHRDDLEGPLFRPVKKPRSCSRTKPLSPSVVYHRIIKRYAR